MPTPVPLPPDDDDDDDGGERNHNDGGDAILTRSPERIPQQQQQPSALPQLPLPSLPILTGSPSASSHPTPKTELHEQQLPTANATPTPPKSAATTTTTTASASQQRTVHRTTTTARTAPPPPPPPPPVSAPFSLWDYLRDEVLATDFDSTQEIKWERVSNFMAVPFAVEKCMLFGMAVCLDSFLYTFTILPLRFCVAIYRLARNYSLRVLSSPQAPQRYLNSSHKCDILKLALIVFSCLILARFTDASKMYHSVRGQDVVKLSVIFNVLEIADRLCCSLGQDLLDSLFSRTTLARRRMPDGSTRQPFLRPAAYFLLALAYVLAHTLVLLYQLVTLNVAINAFDNALLTLLLSNQFVEIKGSVFKKFEKENLFQLTCADIVERFQLGLMLFAIGSRNLIELSGGAPSPMSFAKSTSASVSAAVSNAASNPASMLSPLPTSFTILPSLSLLETVLSPVLIVIASECLVDWLKHAFITKFNHFRPAVYGRFMDVLCSDLVVDGPASSSSTSTSKSQRASHRGASERVSVSAEKGGEGNGNGSTSTESTLHPPSSSSVPSSSFSSSRRTEPPPTSTVPFPHNAESEKAAASAPASSGVLRRARKHTFVDQSPLVARRLGFAALPLACLIVRITGQILSMLSGDESEFDECIGRRPAGGPGLGKDAGFGFGFGFGLGWRWLAIGWRRARSGRMVLVPDAVMAQRMGAALLDGAAHVVGFAIVFVIPWAFLIALKLLLGMNLAAYAAHRHASSPSREREETLNARNRPPIGMGVDELAHEARVSALLDEHGREDWAEGWNLRGEAVGPPADLRRSGVLTGNAGMGGALGNDGSSGHGLGVGESEKPAMSAAGSGNSGAGSSQRPIGSKKEGKLENLMDVSRYTMVRSRIW
ncbi:unnamed protein product [Tilletia caries]|uniref:DUF747-domain-containing protein n=2 Tax=Tilletia TaxID=13289 RepID=A0A177U5A6_9BASI|nr:hypothetical protein CF336_g8142 [Tilletia laevis]KAE8243787.1 hypothetical protein A4X03_0g7677 [Tilletia caries]CAD6968905.1 unnamed protein product [Tilletia controversa]KAE8185517.1 hypothetical protein CF335_g7699 [Tilletia laevis]CAD6887275.1 unnamed protein product [Tilletia caries]